MQESYEVKLNMLQSGEINEIVIEKNDFIALREVLVQREDFKHFSGNAKQGGQVVYTYLEVPRS
ncbi:abortive phage infection protein [Psychrobacillus sp. NPDC096623]|uniref:abortive phage infection protein n=1 Tax=Psychrobacillus sp. NPDC096623 TaxID=3364492 RepID=UPI0037F5C417